MQIINFLVLAKPWLSRPEQGKILLRNDSFQTAEWQIWIENDDGEMDNGFNIFYQNINGEKMDFPNKSDGFLEEIEFSWSQSWKKYRSKSVNIIEMKLKLTNLTAKKNLGKIWIKNNFKASRQLILETNQNEF